MTTTRARRWITPVAAAAALAVGIGIGAASSPEPAQAGPETVTETIETVPAACIDAIDGADHIMSITVDFGNIVADIFATTFPESVEAAYDRDAGAMIRATSDLKGKTAEIDILTDRLSGSTFPADAQACRDSAEGVAR